MLPTIEQNHNTIRFDFLQFFPRTDYSPNYTAVIGQWFLSSAQFRLRWKYSDKAGNLKMDLHV